ncbi:MAG: indolepyruvate oxidoreductase subunit beta [Bacteroidales bacterium]|nr:indolepyruvate oxidoreductase subunit beta [Bacteroidales bacterium]MCB8998964.1 indolepyruvate oxidoreductase subunit beta [Bacteroidales bacterium]MCB9013749.1 indolepyruvate oxidoreductase subunit beta [Bacteroidales bacterium]
MKTDIILSGVGGQGILSIAAAIGMAALEDNLFLKQAEVHGMSQRGGAVQSHLRISDTEVASDLIPKGKADLILSVEPMESLRYLPWLNPSGWLVSNTEAFINIDNYPDKEEIYSEIRKIKNHILIDADRIAVEAGSARSSNMAILGAASSLIPISHEKFHSGIRKIFERKGEDMVKLNLMVFDAGRKAASDYLSR